MRVKKNAAWGEDSSVKSHSWLCSLNICVHVRMFVPMRVCGGHAAAAASTKLRRSPLRAWAGDHDLGKCHSAYGGGSPVTHKAHGSGVHQSTVALSGRSLAV